MSAQHQNTSWPAHADQLSAARAFLRECAQSNSRTLLLPDKDADGLSSGNIIYNTLLHLGLDASLIAVHFPAKGSNIHAPAERERIAAYDSRYVIVTDQGSRGGRPIVDDPRAKTLVVDHHWSEEFPERAVVCSAAQCPPVATSSTLAYVVCWPLVASNSGRRSERGDTNGDSENLKERLEWLCALGTMGDLGTSFKWEPPFPDMRACLKKWTKKALGEVIGLLNAPRRSAEFDVETAWRALLCSSSPKEFVSLSPGSAVKNSDIQRLREARAAVRAETDRCSRKPPTFSGDGRIALIRISSATQVHPLIATRWSSSLKGVRLEIVMCANNGYTPGMTNFACRVAKSRKTRDGGETDIISTLHEYAERVPGLREAMGDDFARGHKEASGGIVRTEQFERLWEAMAAAEGPEGEPPQKRRRTDGRKEAGQKNTLERWLKPQNVA